MSCLEQMGTRTRQGQRKEHPFGTSFTRSLTRDKGMSKNVTTSATFTAANGRITGSNGDFAAFVAGDTVLIENTLLNNGEFIVTGLDGGSQAYLVLDPAPKNEGPIASTLVRTP
jgi:hypothetical protein